jgi:hypothetical protein
MMEEKIGEMLEYFDDEVFEDNDYFENYRKTIITIVSYLLGVPDDKFTGIDRFDMEEYSKLKNNEKATIIKYLCRLRTQFLRNYKSIDDARKFGLVPLENMTEYLDVDGIKFLRTNGLEVNVSNAKTPTVNIAYINQYILDNIDAIKSIVPDWIKFQYIKSLFLMPGGYAGHNGQNVKNSYKKIFNVILEAGKTYGLNRGAYPYQMYVNWPCAFRESDGNILYNDLKFLKLLYLANNDRFQAGQYVVDAREEKKEEIYDFVEEANNIAVFVDCENVDPYAFGATILNLDEVSLSKIKKIILYDDVNTSTAWDYMAEIIKLPILKKDIERVLDNKSLVDITMTAGVCEEYYRNDTESIILVSSDSDFWGLIKQLPDARFLVLNEFRKTSATIIEQLDQSNIKHCYMSDFAQDVIQKFKTAVLYRGLKTKIDHFNESGEFGALDVNETIQHIFYDAEISGAESQVKKEKEAFFNKFLKNGFLIKPIINDDGVMRFQISLNSK